jgi:hypothetical protein
LNLKIDPLTLLDVAYTGAFNGGHVNEDIKIAIVGMNESISLSKVEPSHGSDLHDPSSPAPVLISLANRGFPQSGV